MLPVYPSLWSDHVYGGAVVALVVSVLDSGVVGSIPTLGMVRFWSLGNFIYPDLTQYTQLQMNALYQHCWEGSCDGLASRPGESVQLHSNCLS